MNWTPIDTDLPDDGETVIIAEPSLMVEYGLIDAAFEVWLGYREAGMWFGIEGNAANVTHWMPLPEAPEWVS